MSFSTSDDFGNDLTIITLKNTRGVTGYGTLLKLKKVSLRSFNARLRFQNDFEEFFNKVLDRKRLERLNSKFNLGCRVTVVLNFWNYAGDLLILLLSTVMVQHLL